MSGTFSKPNSISTTVRNFLKRDDIRGYLEEKNFQKIYEACDSLDIDELTCILLYLTQSPEIILQDMNYIPPTMFTDNPELTSIIIPEGIDFIGKSAFKYCDKLQTVKFAGTYMTEGFGPSAFRDCTSLTEFTLIPNYRLDMLPRNCFKNCISLTEVDLSNNKWVTKLGASCFDNCKSLKRISLPPNLSEIDTYCFYGCSSLTEIYLPKGVDLYTDCFSNCTSLKTVYYNGDLENWNKYNGNLPSRIYTFDLVDSNTGEVLIQRKS